MFAIKSEMGLKSTIVTRESVGCGGLTPGLDDLIADRVQLAFGASDQRDMRAEFVGRATVNTTTTAGPKWSSDRVPIAAADHAIGSLAKQKRHGCKTRKRILPEREIRAAWMI